MAVRAYLRASTEDQDAERARAELEAFAEARGLDIVASYVENVSGAKLDRPELFRLLRDCRKNDVLLIEQVDRLSRLTSADWSKLKAEIAKKHVRIVALDLPTSYLFVEADAESFTARMADAINAMLLDMLAAVARKDYEDRRRRQAQGQARAKAATRAGRRTSSAIRRSPRCSSAALPGRRSRTPLAAVAPQSPRSPNDKRCLPPTTRAGHNEAESQGIVYADQIRCLWNGRHGDGSGVLDRLAGTGDGGAWRRRDVPPGGGAVRDLGVGRREVVAAASADWQRAAGTTLASAASQARRRARGDPWPARRASLRHHTPDRRRVASPRR